MKTRNLLDETPVIELDSPITLAIITKCPQKWKLIDMETGEEYVASGEEELYRQWRKLSA